MKSIPAPCTHRHTQHQRPVGANLWHSRIDASSVPFVYAALYSPYLLVFAGSQFRSSAPGHKRCSIIGPLLSPACPDSSLLTEQVSLAASAEHDSADNFDEDDKQDAQRMEAQIPTYSRSSGRVCQLAGLLAPAAPVTPACCTHVHSHVHPYPALVRLYPPHFIMNGRLT